MAFDLQLDVFGALEKWKEWQKIKDWITLGIQLCCSFWLGGSVTTGSCLMAHRPSLEALGSGLVSGSVMAVIIWRRSPLTKGLMLALPEKEAEAEMEANTQVISK